MKQARLIFFVVVLFALWLIFSGRLDATHLILGVVAVALVVVINYRLFKVKPYPELDKPSVSMRSFRLPAYLLWLLKEIIIANIQVAYIILHPKMPIQPKLMRFTSKLPTSTAKVILGNSITLTPGTLTIDIQGDNFLVHSLTQTSSSSLEQGEMQRRIFELYGCDTERAVENVSFEHANTKEELK